MPFLAMVPMSARMPADTADCSTSRTMCIGQRTLKVSLRLFVGHRRYASCLLISSRI